MGSSAASPVALTVESGSRVTVAACTVGPWRTWTTRRIDPPTSLSAGGGAP
eukprot:CAMPEP_0119495880 /NCGR_PEP_ID=MMETSP1344-20130328/19380_1 /TAXON_ID=236787 /ORGANISM="Florenciella parvula, Strain CCMP2471" /LENGTH=50 /DNA_ID=CAMNT_0007531511 /DNA_START=42 /DNA_END=190 /DNA_ORIENTATION=+